MLFRSKHWPLFRKPVLPLSCRVRLGRRFDPPDDVERFRMDLERYFRVELAESFPATCSLSVTTKTHKVN